MEMGNFRVIVGRGQSNIASIREADTDGSEWELAHETKLVAVDHEPADAEWCVIIDLERREIEESDLDADPAVTAYATPSQRQLEQYWHSQRS